MKSRLLVACILGLAALAPLLLMAQPEYMPRFKPQKQSEDFNLEDEEAPGFNAKKERKVKKAKVSAEDALPAGGDSKSINAYLMGRLKELQESHVEQENFGRALNKAWTDFWQQAFSDRKDFDIKMARQRLNHFQTLASVDQDYRRQATSDFEKLQAGLTKSFEASQRKKLEQFVNQLLGEMKSFGLQQDKWLLQFMAESDVAWKAQKQQ